MAPDAAMLAQLRVDPTLLKGILRIGIPTGVQMVVIAMAELALLTMVNGFGSSATAAFGAVNQIVSYVQFPAISIAITCSILGAQTLGAGHPERLGAIVRMGLVMNLCITGTISLLGYVFSAPIVGLFIQETPVALLAQTLLHIMLPSMLLLGASGTMSGIMRASGTVLSPTAISIFCILAIEVPVAWWCSHQFGLTGIWYGYPAAFASMVLLQSSFYHLVWRKKAPKRLV
jgi:Na+-driven multidrug efflux pump